MTGVAAALAIHMVRLHTYKKKSGIRAHYITFTNNAPKVYDNFSRSIDFGAIMRQKNSP
jgi:hypothetical protein